MGLKFRRGSTAQQSGSLAFGEPYVNTTLGTLVVGGATGDIILGTTGTGSTGNFGPISGSGLDITGNANIAGNLTLGGAITIGDATADTVNVIASLSSSLIPQTTNAFDLGSASKIWRDLYISTGSIKFVEGTTVVKSLSAATLTALETATGSSNVSITNLNTTTASLNTSVTNINLTTASLNTSVANLNTFSGSENTKSTTLQTYTTSVDTRFTTLGTLTGSYDTRHTTLGSYTSSLETRMTAVGTSTGSLNTSVTNINLTTASLNTSVTNLNLSSASQQTSIDNLNTFSGSENTKSTTLATYTASVDTRFTTLQTLTGSNAIRLTNLESTTASLSQRVAANEAVSGTFARTNSTNTFNGTQTISGSLFVTQDLIVQGSSSIQNISSSNLVIGAAFVTLNTNSPSARFAGINIIDSGSNGGSGSFFYDAVQDEFIQVHKGNGTNITSSHFVQGPQTYDNLGNELYLTNNRLTKGTGLEHIVDSQITDDGSTVSIPGALTVTGNIAGPIRANNGVVSGSSQITYASISSIPSGIVSGSSQVVGSSITTNTITIGSTSTALGGTSTTLAGLTSVTSTAFVGALTGNASTATTAAALTTARTINGTSFDGSANITIPSLVSGSAQITLSSTTGYGSVLNQAVLTSSSPTFAGLTINGAITATGDITAYYTSDRRHKNSIQTISNAVLKVKQLNGVTWEWNDDVNEVTKTTPKTGLIAQEVQAVLPQVVTERQDGFLALDYSKMMGLMVEAIKEQQIQIEELKAKIGL